jgi:hypothetical protein
VDGSRPVAGRAHDALGKLLCDTPAAISVNLVVFFDIVAAYVGIAVPDRIIPLANGGQGALAEAAEDVDLAQAQSPAGKRGKANMLRPNKMSRLEHSLEGVALLAITAVTVVG